ncbi:MAG: endonuclease, partial [Mycobacterium sp.]|nr:endonuclease [Mycobacterium sp.]
MDRLPETLASWERGALGLEHASVVQQLTAKLDDDLTAEIEEILAGAAENVNPTELCSLGETVKAQSAPDDAADDAEQKRQSQTLSLSQTMDGRWRLDGWLDSEAGMYVSAAIAAFTRTTPLDVEGGLDPIGLRRAEALVRIAKMATAHAESCNGQSSGRHTVVVTIPLAQLISGIGTATVQGGGTITAAAARRLACDAANIPAVLNSASEIVDFGRTRRLVTPGQRRLLDLRDGGCLAPGCDRPAADC